MWNRCMSFYQRWSNSSNLQMKPKWWVGIWFSSITRIDRLAHLIPQPHWGGTNYPPISMVGVPHPRTVEATHPGRMGPWVPCSQPIGVLWDWLVEIPNFIKVIKHFKGVCEIYLRLINNKKPQRSQHAMSPIELGNTRMLTNYAQQSPQTLTHLQSFDK